MKGACGLVVLFLHSTDITVCVEAANQLGREAVIAAVACEKAADSISISETCARLDYAEIER